MRTVYVTGDRCTPESREFGGPEESGWVDWRWSSTTLYERREDVSPLWSDEDDDPDDDVPLVQRVAEAIQHVAGAVETSDGSTFYASDAVIWDYASPDDYTYAVHLDGFSDAEREAIANILA